MTIPLDRRMFIAAGGALLFSDTRAAEHRRVVAVTGGLVEGCDTPSLGVNAWLGIPYAAPPVGALRWRPPQPVVPWQGVRRADRFSASPWAMPHDPKSIFASRPAQMNEDCLTVNVWAPVRASARPRAVMVWIYGGAFAWGTSDNAWYEGTNIAEQDVVFVSFNYRVGILGFFAHPELAAESPDGVSGNYALLDQTAALRWVHENIAAFGGDPDNVTIMGQSAGAFSVAFHMVMPGSRGLFHRAIAQSGAPMGPLNTMSMISDSRKMESAGQAFARRLGAKDIAALRAMDPMHLVEADAGTWIFNPALDHVVIPEHPFDAIRQGRFADVPLIAGFNADEGTLFPPLGGGTPTGLGEALHGFYGAESPAAQRQFSSATAAEATTHGHQAFADLVFNWNTTALATAVAAYGKAPVHFYHFTFRDTLPTDVRLTEGDRQELGAFHGAEIGYALRNPGAMKWPVGPRQKLMTEMVSRYWINFARSGNPNGAHLPTWSRYQPGKPTLLYLNAERTSSGPLPFRDRLSLLGRAWGNAIVDLGFKKTTSATP